MHGGLELAHCCADNTEENKNDIVEENFVVYDDIDDDDDDDDLTISLEEQIEALVRGIDLYPTDYSRYAALLEIFARLQDPEGVAKYREEAAENCAAPEEFWLQWIEEDIACRIPQSHMPQQQHQEVENEGRICQLYDRAIANCPTVALWCSFLRFMRSREAVASSFSIGSSPSNRSQVRASGVRRLHETAIGMIGLHATEGFKIWSSYRQFELSKLRTLLDAEGDTSVAVENQVHLVRRLFHRQLLLPLAGLPDLMDEYRIFEAELPTRLKATAEELKAADEFHARGQIEWERRKEVEVSVARDLEDLDVEGLKSLSKAWDELLAFERERGDSGRIGVAYLRACEDLGHVRSDLWIDWIDFLMDTLNDSVAALKVLDRAVRHHPSNTGLWKSFLLCQMETAPCDVGALSRIYRRALRAFGSRVADCKPSEFQEVYLTAADGVRRALLPNGRPYGPSCSPSVKLSPCEQLQSPSPPTTAIHSPYSSHHQPSYSHHHSTVVSTTISSERVAQLATAEPTNFGHSPALSRPGTSTSSNVSSSSVRSESLTLSTLDRPFSSHFWEPVREIYRVAETFILAKIEQEEENDTSVASVDLPSSSPPPLPLQPLGEEGGEAGDDGRRWGATAAAANSSTASTASSLVLHGSDPEGPSWSAALFPLLLFWGRMESQVSRDLNALMYVGEKIIRTNKTDAVTWATYISLARGLLEHSPPDAYSVITELFRRARKVVTKQPELIAREWLQFERDFGTVESFRLAMREVERTTTTGRSRSHDGGSSGHGGGAPSPLGGHLEDANRIAEAGIAETLRSRRAKRRRKMSESSDTMDGASDGSSSESGSYGALKKKIRSSTLWGENYGASEGLTLLSLGSSGAPSSPPLTATPNPLQDPTGPDLRPGPRRRRRSVSSSPCRSSCSRSPSPSRPPAPHSPPLVPMELVTRATWDGHESILPDTAPNVPPLASCRSPISVPSSPPVLLQPLTLPPPPSLSSLSFSSAQFPPSRRPSSPLVSTTTMMPPPDGVPAVPPHRRPRRDSLEGGLSSDPSTALQGGSSSAGEREKTKGGERRRPAEPAGESRKKIQLENRGEEKDDEGLHLGKTPYAGKHFNQMRVKGDPTEMSKLLGCITEETTIWVSNLDHEVSEEELNSIYEEKGGHGQNIKEIRLVRDFRHRPKGFAYIEFYTNEQAVEAANLLNGHICRERKIKALLSRPSAPTYEPRTVFISGLMRNTTEKEVENSFSSFHSTLRAIRLARETTSGACKGYGYVEFSDEDSVTTILSSEFKNTFMLHDKPLVVSPSIPMKKHKWTLAPTSKTSKREAWEAREKERTEPKPDPLSVLVKNLPYSASENDIQKFFEDRCGPVESVFLCRKPPPDCSSKGFAFVKFHKEGDSMDALTCNDAMFGDREITVSRSMRQVTQPKYLQTARTGQTAEESEEGKPRPRRPRPQDGSKGRSHNRRLQLEGSARKDENDTEKGMDVDEEEETSLPKTNEDFRRMVLGGK